MSVYEEGASSSSGAGAAASTEVEQSAARLPTATLAEVRELYRVVPIAAEHQAPLEMAAQAAFREHSWTKARRELEPDAPVDEHGFLVTALPSVTVGEGDLLLVV